MTVSDERRQFLLDQDNCYTTPREQGKRVFSGNQSDINKEYRVSPLAVHFGAGSIGRGFLGQLYFQSGFQTVFIDVVDAVVEAINRRGAYPVHIVSDADAERILVGAVSAIHGREREAVADALSRADIASTAVGLHALNHIAPLVARGIERRFSRPEAAPLDIILCENVKNGEEYMRSLLREHLPPPLHERFDKQVGIVEASIGRMVPVMTPERQENDPLLVCVEPYCDLPVDANGFRGPIPDIVHLQPARNFAAYVERKLFVHNLTHAATAYLGYRRGHAYIWEAIRDSYVRERVEEAGRESCQALARKHGMDQHLLDEHRADLIFRYHNRALADQIARVARDPVRKLRPDDRLIGAACLCAEQGIAPEGIAVAAAAAILYDNPEDADAQAVQRRLQEGGAEAVLREFCGLNPETTPGALIMEAFHQLLTEKG